MIILPLLICTQVLFSQNKVKLKNAQKFAGIEVGSKGVKLSLLDVEMSGSKVTRYNIIKDTSINSDFISFNKTSFNETYKALLNLYFIAGKAGINKANIFTVISSGVKVQSEKENKVADVKRLIDTFKNAINENNRQFKVIDVVDEARLSHLGIVPESRRYSTFIIDIGSGNTKGGYFPNGNMDEFKLFQLTWGTKSVSNETEKRLGDDKSFANYKRNLARVLAGQANSEITYAVNVSNAFMMNDYVAFSGGISWASATLLYPELIDNSVVGVTYDDVKKLYDKIAGNYSSLSENVVATGITDKSFDKAPVLKEVKRVHQVFDQKALLAGTGLLLSIMRQFEGVYEKKQFYLVKNGQVGWVSAYVNQQISK